MSILCMNVVLDSATELDQVETLVLVVLAQHADDSGGNCWPSQQTIATKARATTRGVRNVLARLVDRGLISVVSEPSAKRSARYQIHLDAFPARTYRPEPGSSQDGVRPERRSSHEVVRPEPRSSQDASRPEHGSPLNGTRPEPGSAHDDIREEQGSAQTGTGFLSERNGVPLRPERGSSDPSLIRPVTVQEHTHAITISDVDQADAADTRPCACAPDVALTDRDREFVASRPLLAPGLASHGAAPDGVSPFERFWAAYPRKVARTPAAKAWKALAPNAAVAQRIHAGLAAWVASPSWRESLASDPERRHIPHASTWLNQRRWEEAPVLNGRASAASAEGEPTMPKELIRLLDAAGVRHIHRQLYFRTAAITHDRDTGEATIVIADAEVRASVERSFHEALEAAVIAQGGRRLRICGSAAA